MQYSRIADHLAREGFFPKAVALYKKVLKFNPHNEYALMQTAEMSARQGLLAAAKSHLASLVERRLARGDARGAAEVRARMGLLDPADLDARLAGARATAEIGQPADAARLLAALGLEMQGRGRTVEALELLSEAATLAPGEADVQHQLGNMRAMLVRQALDQGDVAAARDQLSSVAIGRDPERRLLAAEIEFRSGAYESANSMLQELLLDAPELGERMREMSRGLVAFDVNAGFACADTLAADAVAHDDWTEAASTLTEFLEHAPRHVPALIRLIEVCIDGGMLDRLDPLQAQLADAYLDQGRAADARVVAEDLAMRTPWDRVHVERLRQALALDGEADPSRVIADKLSGSRARTETESDAGVAQQDPRFRLSANAIDVHAILSGELDESAARMMRLERVELVEVDLSAAIEGLSDDEEADSGGAMNERKDSPDIEGVFEEFRNEVSKQDSADAAGQHIKLATTYQEMGLVDEAIGALQAAARSPRYRFEAASRLGRLLTERGKVTDAIEWFERAAEAPAATADEGRALLYDLAGALEASGEPGRALAVYLEIQSDASGYRDVAIRVQRLSRLQSKE